MEGRDWMCMGRESSGQVTNEWIRKTDDFVERAYDELLKELV